MFLTKPNKQLFFQPARGFTLIEVIIALTIIGIISIIFYQFLEQSFLIQRFVTEQSEAVAEAQSGMESITKELREASDADSGAFLLELAEQQEIIFFSDIDADSNTERVRYFIEDSSLKKGIIEPSGSPLEYANTETIEIISAYLVNEDTSIFTYYNENYPTDTTPLDYPADVSETTLVQIHLEINVNPEKIPDTYAINSYIQIRNQKNNL